MVEASQISRDWNHPWLPGFSLGNASASVGTTACEMTRVFDQQSNIAPLITPQGLRVVGGVRNPNGMWRPLMVDPATGQCVWQGAGEFSATYGVWTPRFATRGDAVFVFNEGWLGCFDAGSGAQRWRAQLGADLSRTSNRWLRDGATDDLAIDVLTTQEGSVAVVRNDDDLVIAFDMHTGAPLWRVEPYSGRYWVVPGIGVLIHVEDAPSEFRGPRGDVKWSMPIYEATAAGRHIFAKVRGENDALVCVDAATGQERWRVEEDSVDHVADAAAGNEQATVAVNGSFSQRVWSVSAQAAPPKAGFFARLFGKTHGTDLPVKRATLGSTTRVGNRVFIVANSPAGKHLVVLDASNGQPVAAPFALGPIDWVHVRGQGDTAVLRCEHESTTVLRGFGPDGAQRWQRELEDASEHFCRGTDVIVELPRQVAVLDAADGSTRFAYAN